MTGGLYGKSEEELRNIIQEAQDAFFKVVAQHWPGAMTGDFPPDSQYKFDKDCRYAISTWLDFNF